jgi:hypothetical protein
MPSLSGTTVFTANQKNVNLFAGWQFEFAPFPCRVKILARSTTAGNVITLYTGSETVQESSPVQGGGTAGTTPAELTTPAYIFHAAGGDRLKTKVDEVLGGTPTLDFLITLDPL